MKKETVNTFGEGLIMDLHPLTTPNNVLTNCLNGTIITYNGNEFVLQNDMGNGQVHTAYLDKGYIPVGIKEHGGVIYVAAHNPITKKSQIGSFPSPQQLYEGDDLNVIPIQFDFSKFFTVKNSIPYIKLEYFKQKLFQNVDTGEVKTFHPGDKFIIVSNTIDEEIKQAITDNVLKLRLGVINSSGNIDYIDESKLKIYSNGLWILESSQPIEEILKQNENIQVFSAKSSGVLVLIIELKTFDTFNLLRKYHCDESNNISVTFIGETTGTFAGNTQWDENIGLIEQDSTQVEQTIVKTGKEGKIQYKIMPVCPYGVLERLAKNGIIDFDSIRTNSESLNEWRFYVTDNYLKIGWGYDYYNMNEDSDIDKIEFTFIDIKNSNQADQASTLEGYKYEISKEYYNGSFEEIIPFENIKKDWIYIVRIDRYVKGVKTLIGYQLVYTGTYFNQFYGSVQNFNNTLPSGEDRDRVLLEVKSNSEIYTTLSSTSTTKKTGLEIEHTTTELLNPQQFVNEVESVNSDVSQYKYEVGKIGTYSVEFNPNIQLSYDTKEFVGDADPNFIESYFGDNPTISDVEFDNSNVTINKDSVLGAYITPPSANVSKTFTWKQGSFKGNINVSRYIYSKAGGVVSRNVRKEKLSPVYNSNIDTAYRNQLFSFREIDGRLICVLSSDDSMEYNAAAYADGTWQGGVNSGAGSDDSGLQVCLSNMGNGTIGIFGGKDGDEAALWYNARRVVVNGWGSIGQMVFKNEVDVGDDFLFITWKDQNKYHFPVNLASRRTESITVGDSELLRVEIMIKCLLSQLLVVGLQNDEVFITGADSQNFIYHNAANTICNIVVDVPNGGENVDVDFFLPGDDTSIESHMSKWASAIPELHNYLPIFNAHKDTKFEFNVEIGDDIDFQKDSNILNCFLNAYSSFNTEYIPLESIDRNKIYIADSSVNHTINSDGSITFDQIIPKDVSSREMIDWNNQPWTFTSNMNDMFVTQYYLDNINGGRIPDGYYNEILIKNIDRRIGKWTKGKDTGAPDLAVNVLLSNKSIFT